MLTVNKLNFKDIMLTSFLFDRSERVASNRHIILVASQSAYDEVPIFESNNYRGLKYEEILQSLQKVLKIF